MKCFILFGFLGLTLSLGGCGPQLATMQLPSSQIPATKFDESRFAIPAAVPLPGPNATGDDMIDDDAGLRKNLGTVTHELTSVEQELDKNGQVVHATKPAKPMFRKTKTTKKAGS